jgi:hypothetical protein
MEKRSGDKANGVAATTTKKPRTALRKAAPAVAVPKKDPERGHGGEEPKTLDVTLPVDALECPLCFVPFEAALFQASHHHLTLSLLSSSS